MPVVAIMPNDRLERPGSAARPSALNRSPESVGDIA